MYAQLLSNEQMQKAAPSIFARQAYEKTSDNYKFISTADMMFYLDELGWKAREVKQTRCLSEDRKEFTKHIVRFRQVDAPLPMVGDSVPELVLLNSHDGKSSYQFYAGLFRLVCLNGLVVQSHDFRRCKARHAGVDAETAAIEGSFEIVRELPAIAEKVDQFQSIQLSRGEQLAMGAAALQLRWDGDSVPVEPAQIIQARRHEDQKADLWSTFQRIQENLVRGGLSGRNALGRSATTRAVNAVDSNVKLNRALWTLTEEMSKLKTGGDYLL